MRLRAGIFLAVVQLTTWVVAQSPAALGEGSGVNVANVPDCAKACLSNSTQYASDCPQIDVKCLCNSPAYVSALSCCLATNCNAADQQTALQFNIQECAAVNSTAPNFVGCSPFSLTTGSSNLKPTSASANSQITTISGDLANIPTAFTTTKLGTAAFDGSSVLTGSCTIPFFAQITASGGPIKEFPQVGCALNRGACCPFDPSQYIGITKCPADYTTTSGGCCPSGYSVYFTALGAETPCYSKPTLTYLPATTPTNSATLITDAIFSKRYVLVQPAKKQLPTGGIVGISIIAVLFVGLPFVIYYLIRRHKAQKAAKESSSTTGETFPPEEPALQSQPHMSEVAGNSVAPHELSPDSTTPATMKTMPFQQNMVEKPADSIAHEMPGSMYIHEHHPAFTESQSDVRTGTSTPRTPPRSPAATSTRSPVLSPSSPFRAESLNGSSNVVITPLGSPRPLTSSPSTRFREGTM